MKQGIAMRKSTPLIGLFIGVCIAGMNTIMTNAADQNTVANVPTNESDHARYDPRAKSEMDDLASPEEMAGFMARAKTDAVLFVEDRANSIRWAKALPKRWLGDPAGHTGSFKGQAQPGEFYVFQIGVFAAKRDLSTIAVAFGDLTPGGEASGGGSGKIAASALRCINLGGINFQGKPFEKNIDVAQGKLQALWIGIDVPQNAKGAYQGKIAVKDAKGFSAPVAVELKVEGGVLQDHGDRDSWRLSRLRWLDSTIGFDDDTVTQPYLPLARGGTAVNLLGRSLALNASGLPEQINSFFNAGNTAIEKAPTRQLLTSPFRFIIETTEGTVALAPGKIEFIREQKGAVEWRAASQGAGIELAVEGLIEYDGFVRCVARVKSSKEIQIKDIRLEFDVAKEADYFMGLGLPSGHRPEKADWKWDTQVNQDGFWIGAVNGGFKLQLFGDNWRAPLINCYYHFRPLNIPGSWGGADGKSGGIRLATSGAGAMSVQCYSGPRAMKSGETLSYGFNLFLTPFHPLNTEEQWAMRYLHKGQGVEDNDYRDLKRVKDMGANVINIHHNKEQNPTINYPYFDMSMPLLKQCVASGHANGVKVKIYYTTRELTNNLPELFVFWSLDGEIICPSPGKDGVKARPLTNGSGPHRWLVDHLGETGFIPAWREVLHGRYKDMLDLAVITTPESRLDNFYLEGLAFTLRETGFDGLYIDDTALGRKAFQRAHRIFEASGKRLFADMHSWSHWNPTAGRTASAYCFMQNFPYYHRLWFGEGHNYNAAPEHWMVELSGIPFGLMGEMLQGGGNKWRGMIYGMTQRLGWSGDPKPQWKLWDSFGMVGTTMLGYWDPACPVKSDNKDILATVYQKKGKALICVASWAPGRTRVKLTVDWQALGLDPKKATLWAPAVENFQPEAVFAADGAIPVEPGKGWMLIADETPRAVSAESGAIGIDPLKGLTLKKEETSAFEISVPANAVWTKDIAWPAGATVAVARIDPKQDAGQSWGVGLAVGWTGGKYVQINARTDGRWGVRRNGAESLMGSHPKGKPATLAIKLGDKTIQLLAKEDGAEDWDVISEFPRNEFPGVPTTARIGKIGGSWEPRNHGDWGSAHPCRVEWVKFY
ncbi:MAG: DUF6067 family protein [Candidatus Sumerlaeota bacterium]|nr:DUF6067 family protein [Candidatus Sumerlaeota bacterium]